MDSGQDPINYRLITCLPLIWKLFTGLIADIYRYTYLNRCLPEEQKGCRTHDLLYIDRMIRRDVKQRKKNLAARWIDYWKDFDMIHNNWILKRLKIFGVNNITGENETLED